MLKNLLFYKKDYLNGAMLLLIFTLIIGLSSTVISNAQQPELPSADLPILITSCGQSSDANIVSLLSKRIGLEHTYEGLIKAEALNNFKTLILVIGGSGKGLGAAGVDIPWEIERCNKLIEKAREEKMYIIGMHIGGEDRRGPNSASFIPFAAKVDYLIVKDSGNKDGYFTQIATENKIPLYIIIESIDVQELLKKIFNVE